MLRKYLAETERHYNYRIKMVVPMDDAVLDRIERTIQKYIPLDIGRPEKTIFQSQPLDFPGVENREVYYVDVRTSLPASSYVMQQDIRMALGIPEKFIVVRGENEPTEVETGRLNAITDMADEAKEKGLTPAALLDDAEYQEASEVDAADHYGDKYNARLTAYLKKIADERIKIELETVNAPFKWLGVAEQEPVQDKADFNADIEGAPKAASTGADMDEKTSKHGNYDENTRTHKRVYKDASGNRKVLDKTASAVKRKGD